MLLGAVTMGDMLLEIDLGNKRLVPVGGLQMPHGRISPFIKGIVDSSRSILFA